MPYKMINAFTSNIPLYFMINLRREAGECNVVSVCSWLTHLCTGPFFFYLLISFVCTLAMSGFFRLVAASSRSLIQALLPSAVIMIGLVMYAGFAIPVSYMRGWAAWMRYLNPIYFALEALLINEFVGRTFQCTEIVPSGSGYDGATGLQRSCAALGSEPGSLEVSGQRYIEVMYEAVVGHKWRDFGILLAFTIVLSALYLVASGKVSLACDEPSS
jgi:ATP-binding cassette subfamily G (WHITE) protein 2 (PDR)